MKILITGGVGFIGSNLSNYFIEQGHQVTVIDNLITGRKENITQLFNNPNFSFIKADICTLNFDSLNSFDLIYHLPHQLPLSNIKNIRLKL